MKKILTTFFSIALSTVVLSAGNDGATNTFIETYDDGTDVGLWHCSVGVPRDVEANGGNPAPMFSRAASARPYRHGRASRRVFNREFPTRTRLTAFTRATGPPSVLPA
jgi:hypothetical protein